MIRTLLRRCPVCGCESGEILHRQRFAVVAEFGNDETVDIVACLACGFVFSDLQIQQAALDAIYADHSKYADTSTHGQRQQGEVVATEPPWDRDRLDDTARYLATRVVDRNARILDAGCSTGSLLAFLEREGFIAPVGIDPSPGAVRIAREVHKVDARAGSLAAPPSDMGSFDVVVLAHVLEHVADVRQVVRSLRDVLNSGGLAYVEVPDASRYADYVHAPFQDFNTEHINHFSPGLLNRAMEEGGFEACEIVRKTVMCGPDLPYPVVYGLWRRAEHPPASPAVRSVDTELVGGIRRYVAASRQLTQRFDDCLRAHLDARHPVILWGAGQLALRLLCDTMLKDVSLLTIVDTSPQKQGLHVGGTTVQSPRVLRSSDVPIVVASINSSRLIEQSIRREFGLTNPVVLLAD
jgi:2-polyprenyl-3-methyl-5-hydroxy-6-metoxy-1,4-benzoquinol methylase